MSITTQAPFIETGNPSLLGFAPNITQHLADYFDSPLQVENYRRAVRSWFVSYAADCTDRIGPFDFSGNINTYEIIDELLSGLIQQATNQTQA